MKNCTKKCACPAATEADTMHSEYQYNTTRTRARQARKRVLTDKHIRAALTAIGFALLIAAASAGPCDALCRGRRTAGHVGRRRTSYSIRLKEEDNYA